MDFLVNELSLAGQFYDIRSFHLAVARLMQIRQEIQRLGSSLYCHRKLAQAQVTAGAVMQQAIQGLPIPQRSAWMQWLTRQGPYWEDARTHDAGDWLEVEGNIVTDTAVGEAAICRYRGLLRELVSFTPSDWLFTPITAKWMHDDQSEEDVLVSNHWEIATVQACLAANPPPIASWRDLAVQTQRACTRLTFAANAFQKLEGHPFAPGAAGRIQVLLNVLDTLRGCFDQNGRLNAEGHRLYTNHFTGDKAWFSDSSDTEKNDFRHDLTFRNPEDPTQTLFCSWHGKVKTPQIRIHFSWPVRSGTPLYVVYVGPKITVR